MKLGQIRAAIKEYDNKKGNGRQFGSFVMAISQNIFNAETIKNNRILNAIESAADQSDIGELKKFMKKFVDKNDDYGFTDEEELELVKILGSAKPEKNSESEKTINAILDNNFPWLDRSKYEHFKDGDCNLLEIVKDCSGDQYPAVKLCNNAQQVLRFIKAFYEGANTSHWGGFEMLRRVVALKLKSTEFLSNDIISAIAQRKKTSDQEKPNLELWPHIIKAYVDLKTNNIFTPMYINIVNQKLTHQSTAENIGNLLLKIFLLCREKNISIDEQIAHSLKPSNLAKVRDYLARMSSQQENNHSNNLSDVIKIAETNSSTNSISNTNDMLQVMNAKPLIQTTDTPKNINNPVQDVGNNNKLDQSKQEDPDLDQMAQYFKA